MTTTFIGASGQSHPQISSDPVTVLRFGLRLELGTPLVNEVNTWLAGNSAIGTVVEVGQQRRARSYLDFNNAAIAELVAPVGMPRVGPTARWLTASISASAPRPDDHAALVLLRKNRSLPITFAWPSRDCRRHGCARSHRWRSDGPPVESFPPTGW